jgi:hypothetical protein
MLLKGEDGFPPRTLGVLNRQKKLRHLKSVRNFKPSFDSKKRGRESAKK